MFAILVKCITINSLLVEDLKNIPCLQYRPIRDRTEKPREQKNSLENMEIVVTTQQAKSPVGFKILKLNLIKLLIQQSCDAKFIKQSFSTSGPTFTKYP